MIYALYLFISLQSESVSKFLIQQKITSNHQNYFSDDGRFFCFHTVNGTHEKTWIKWNTTKAIKMIYAFRKSCWRSTSVSILFWFFHSFETDSNLTDWRLILTAIPLPQKIENMNSPPQKNLLFSCSLQKIRERYWLYGSSERIQSRDCIRQKDTLYLYL